MLSLRRISIFFQETMSLFCRLILCILCSFLFYRVGCGVYFWGPFSPKATKELHTKKICLDLGGTERQGFNQCKSAWWTPAEHFCQTTINLLAQNVCQWPKISHRNGLAGPLLTQQEDIAKWARNLGFVVWWLKRCFLSYSLSSSSWVWSVRYLKEHKYLAKEWEKHLWDFG